MISPEEKGESGIGVRPVVLAVCLTLFLLATSCYIAIRLGSLPWPIIFSVIVSAGILKATSHFRGVSIHEANVAQAGSTIGGLMASGVAFTIPGILFLRDNMGIDISMPDTWVLAAVCVFAGVLGVLLSIPLRRTFVDEEKLPYPSGAAGAEILKAQMKGGSNALIIAFVVLLAGIFALCRDILIPAGWTISSLAPYGIYLTIMAMPLAIGIGYILGPRIALNSWFTGSVAGWIIIIPILIARDWLPGNTISFVQNLGMGIVLGSGMGFFFTYVVPKIKKIFAPLFTRSGPWYFRASPILSIVSLFVLIAIGVPVLASVVAVLGVWMMATVAARMTGETNIDPLEQFGIIVGLAAIGLYSLLGMDLGYTGAFLIVTFVSVSAAISGDIGHDYKSAQIIGTRPTDIITVDMICVIVAGLAAPFFLDIILTGYADVLFTAQMPAPQAQLVAGSIFGFAYPNAFYAGFGLAFVYEVAVRLLKKNPPASAMAFGIGMFLGLTLGILLAVGGLIAYIVSSRYSGKAHTGVLVAAGLMGGEGIAGFLTPALFVGGMTMSGAQYSVLGAFVVCLLLAAVYVLWRRR